MKQLDKLKQEARERFLNFHEDLKVPDDKLDDFRSFDEYVIDKEMGFLDTLIDHIATTLTDEMVKRLEGEKIKEYEYEHTYPNEIGVDMGNGYEKRISKGQKETLTYKLDEDELLYNNIFTQAQTIIREVSKL